jgi:hypothetical protein
VIFLNDSIFLHEIKFGTVQKDEPDVPEPLMRSNIIDAPSQWLKDEKMHFSA